jgi:3-dehydroquinate synthase
LQKNLSNIIEHDEKVLMKIIYRAIQIKADVVQHDERDNHQRALLNFGHTIGHAIEKLSNYTILHGFAVAYGILVEAKLSQLLGLLAQQEYVMIEALFQQMGIKRKTLEKFSANDILKYVQRDKKIILGQTRYILLANIGNAYQKGKDFTHTVPDQIVQQALLQTLRR